MRDHASLFFLFRQLLGRELFARYRATTLGAMWLVLQPLMMLVVYTLVFSGIFKVRWAGAESSTGFALVLFAGLIVFNFFAEVLVSSPTLVSSQPNYVKKVVFPIEMLAVIRVALALSTALISLGILFFAQFWFGDTPSPWFALAPLILIEMVPMLLGIAWLVSALSVYVQDIAQVAGVLASVMLFVSPIFFPPSAIPAGMEALISLNPLVGPMQQLRAVTVEGVAPEPSAMGIHFMVSCIFAVMCLKAFRHLSRGFADVL